MNVRVIERTASSKTTLYTSIVAVTIYGHLVMTTDKNGEQMSFRLSDIVSITVDNDGAVT